MPAEESPVGTLCAIQASIRRYGHHVISVTDGKPFAYTIGHAGIGLPEFILVGLAPDVSCRLLNVLADMQAKKKEALLGDVDLGGVIPCRLRAVSDLRTTVEQYTCWVSRFFGTSVFDVTQVVVPDSRGLFPGDPKCRPPYADQVLL